MRVSGMSERQRSSYWIISVPGGYSTHSWERVGDTDRQVVFDVVPQAYRADRYPSAMAAEDDLWDFWGGNGTCIEVRS